MLLEFPIGNRKIKLISASVAPTEATVTLHARIGYSFNQSTGDDGSIDIVEGPIKRYYPLTLNYPRELQGPGKLYAAVLAADSASPNPFTFNVAYEVMLS